MKIEYDETNKIIRVGKAEFKQFEWYGKKSEAWTNKVLEANDLGHIRLNVYSKNSKEQNKEACDALGCSRAQLYSHYDKLSKKVFVAPIYDILKKVDFSRRGWPVKAIHKINKHKELAQQVYDDGLYNILPVVIATGKSPQQLKKEMKGAWKIVCNNSLNRNKTLAKMVRFEAESFTPDALIKHFANTIPITLLTTIGVPTQLPVLEYLRDNFKGHWNDSVKMSREAILARDTCSIAQRLGYEFNPKWTPRRMKEEHDRMSREILAQKFSPVPFEWTKDLPQVIEHEGYVATLLNSRMLIAEEGSAMGHCVARYADDVAAGDYLVYSVTKDGERSSTVGLYLRQISRDEIGNPKPTQIHWWKLQQHYKRFNHYVTEQAEKEIGNKIVEALNLYEKGKSCTSSS